MTAARNQPANELPLFAEEQWRRRLEVAAWAVCRARTTEAQTEAITELEHELKALERQKVEHARELADPRRQEEADDNQAADPTAQPMVMVRTPKVVGRGQWQVECEAHPWARAGSLEKYVLLVHAPNGDKGWRATVRRTQPVSPTRTLLEHARRQALVRVRELFEVADG